MKSKSWLKRLALTVLGLSVVGAGVAAGAAALIWKEERACASIPEAPKVSLRRIVCSGRVEAKGGEVQVFAQIAGRLKDVLVRDGDAVTAGQAIAVLEGGRTAADVEIAAAQVRVADAALQKLIAGAGEEEKTQALHAIAACEAELAFAKSSLERLRPLVEKKIRSIEELEALEQQAARLAHQRDGLAEQHKALARPARPADLQTAQANLDLARAQLARAEVEQEYTVVRAPQAGVVLKVMLHPGDSVAASSPTPIVLLADTSDLQVRLEMDEANVPLLMTEMEGRFEIRGLAGEHGTLKLEKIIPVYGPKRLFSPDTSLGHDTRMLEVLCKIEDSPTTLYLGQRVTAKFEVDHNVD